MHISHEMFWNHQLCMIWLSWRIKWKPIINLNMLVYIRGDYELKSCKLCAETIERLAFNFGKPLSQLEGLLCIINTCNLQSTYVPLYVHTCIRAFEVCMYVIFNGVALPVFWNFHFWGFLFWGSLSVRVLADFVSVPYQTCYTLDAANST